MEPRAETAAGNLQARRRVPLQERLREAARHDLGPALVGSVLPFVLVFYLALRGGGYDSVVYGEVGIVVWWLLLLGALVGVLPAARISRAGWIALGLLAAFAAWTALGIAWSESAERSAAEAGRVATYLGVFALALTVQGKDGRRRTLNAVAAAIALVGFLALLSRLHPAWFPANDGARLLPAYLANRLSYPLNYWNGLAMLMALGMPLVLVAAMNARYLVTRALAAAALPAMSLTAFYTFSRGVILVMGLAVLAFLALYPRRLATLPTLLVSGAGAALLIGAATQRDALENHVLVANARAEGDEMLAMVLVVCAGVGLVQVAISLAARHRLGPQSKLSRRQGAVFAAGAVAAAMTIALAAGVPGELVDRLPEGDRPAGIAVGTERFGAGGIENRQRYWESALDANATAPLVGIGPGTFEFWWARSAGGGFVRDAHSLFLESLAEVGVIGLVLVVSVLAVVLGAGIRRLVTSGPGVRTTVAAAIASCVVFTAAAAIDWVWELPVLPVAFLLVAAAILGQVPVTRGEVTAVGQDPLRQARLRERVGVVALAILALIAIAVPFVSTRLVQESQSQLRSGEPDSALRSAEAAETVNPFATTANRQQALALERSGELARAVDAGRDATRDEPTNWRSWLLLSHLEAKRGRAEEAADAYNRAFALNPSSSVFTFEDFVTTLNVHTDASVGRGSDFRGIQVGIQGKRLGPNDRLLATAEPGGVGLRLYKIVNGVYTQLGSNGTFTLLANTDYWLQFQIEGNALEARLYASDPDFGNPSSVASTSHTLTGRDASTFGKGVMGKLGIETSPTGTDWSYDDWRVNTRDGSALRDEPAGFASSLAG